MMKRILFVHQTSAIGGGSYCLLNILREIDKSMIEPVVCLASDGPLRKEIESLKISVVFFGKNAHQSEYFPCIIYIRTGNMDKFTHTSICYPEIGESPNNKSSQKEHPYAGIFSFTIPLFFTLKSRIILQTVAVKMPLMPVLFRS